MTADRSRPTPGLSPASTTEPVPSQRAQSASFCIGEIHLELTATTGAARLVVGSGQRREVYVIDPAALHAWARRVTQVLSLVAAASPSGRVEYRTPFLIDREGRAALAVEAQVDEQGVSYRVLAEPASTPAPVPVDAEALFDLVDAAEGIARLAHPRSPAA